MLTPAPSAGDDLGWGLSSVMGARLVAIVDRVRTRPNGLPGVDLARLNLKVGKALSRLAATMDDDPELIARAERAAREIITEGATQS